jgi:pimeloyl-ACP methyl ester carboxylesterase
MRNRAQDVRIEKSADSRSSPEPVVIQLPPAITDAWPYRPNFRTVNGYRMHYVDEGAGDPVLLLHGNPTWGFLYRDFIAPLVASGRRVVVPDMIGAGLSGKPTHEQAYSIDGHAANLAALARQLDLKRLVVVCHDWGGPVGLSFAMNDVGRVRALAVMSTWAWPEASVFHRRLFPWRMLHAPVIGPYFIGRGNALARRGIYLSVLDRERFLARALPAYEAVLADPSARTFTLAMPRWIALDAQSRGHKRLNWLEQRLAECSLPTLILWGRQDDVFPADIFAARFKNLLANAQGPYLVDGKHFLQEDSGPELAALLTDFIDRLDARGD